MNDEAFLLERYKYVLEQKRTLNETTFKIVSLFQVVMAAAAAGDYEVIKSAQAGTINPSTALLAVHVLYAGFLVAALACLCLLIGGVVSWLDYRADESQIEVSVHGRPKPEITWFAPLRWYETYIALTMVAAMVGYSLALPSLSRECERSVGVRALGPPHNLKPAPKV